MSETPQMSGLARFFLRSPVLAALGSGLVVVVWLVGVQIPLVLAGAAGMFTVAAQWVLWRGGESSYGYRIKRRQAERRSRVG